MKSFAAVLFLACAVSGQLIGAPWGINRAWNGAPVAWNGGWNGAPVAYSAPTVAYNAPMVAPAPMAISSQYHSQDELGQASFGYAHPGQASANYRDAMGNQVGSYAYINPNGKEVRVSYVADSLGFRVLSNDLPVAPIAGPVAALPMPLPVSDTIEVVEARNAHMAAHAAARSGLVATPVMIAELPQPVQDTPEVAAAKAAHLAAKAAITGGSRKKRQIALGAPLSIGSALPYSGSWMTGSALPLAGNWMSPMTRMVGSPLALSSPLAYSAPMMAAPMAYSAPVMAAPAVRDATLTTIVNTPGHAMSYRVD